MLTAVGVLLFIILAIAEIFLIGMLVVEILERNWFKVGTYVALLIVIAFMWKTVFIDFSWDKKPVSIPLNVTQTTVHHVIDTQYDTFLIKKSEFTNLSPDMMIIISRYMNFFGQALDKYNAKIKEKE